MIGKRHDSVEAVPNAKGERALSENLILAGLGLILAAVLVLPFVSRKVEHNLELFLFVMGLGASAVSGGLGVELAVKAVREPVLISLAVLAFGLAFRALQGRVHAAIATVLRVVSPGLFAFLLTVVLGLTSSLITAIIASLVLVEVIGVLRLERKTEVALVVFACFSIGLGAALTPVGEPLSTIAAGKLGQGFWYLFKLLGLYVVPGVLALGGGAAFYVSRASRVTGGKRRAALPSPASGGLDDLRPAETYGEVVLRALKVYLFVMALVLLGEGFKPAIDRFVLTLSPGLLYWINMISAVVDNATIAAAEISPRMTALQLKSILMGLLIAGGMLIPGNIPNIIAANKLRIGSREWASIGVPLGLVVMVIYFVVLFV
jgi:predicted cation transporter